MIPPVAVSNSIGFMLKYARLNRVNYFRSRQADSEDVFSLYGPVQQTHFLFSSNRIDIRKIL